jgi:hypothetical protein
VWEFGSSVFDGCAVCVLECRLFAESRVSKGAPACPAGPFPEGRPADTFPPGRRYVSPNSC